MTVVKKCVELTIFKLDYCEVFNKVVPIQGNILHLHSYFGKPVHLNSAIRYLGTIIPAAKSGV